MLIMNHFPLAELSVNQQAVIVAFDHGHADMNRLASLGFTPGAKVDMTQNYGHGPLIVTVRGMRIALGRPEAALILVERNSE